MMLEGESQREFSWRIFSPKFSLYNDMLFFHQFQTRRLSITIIQLYIVIDVTQMSHINQA
jgi:hypothetical protein